MIKKGWLYKIIWHFFFFTMITGVNATNYYIDPVHGNDNNAGTSPQKAFRTFKKLASLQVKEGDSILLRSGATFTEPLYFSGKGSSTHPIVIGKYGGKKKPHLKGDAKELQMVHIYNSENIIIRDIEISNKGFRIRPHLSGLLVELNNYGVAKNIVIENLFVHDVYGSLIKGEGNNDKDAGGGQAMWIKSLAGTDHDSIPSCFDGLLVENCFIKNCQRNGIIMWGNWVRKYWFPSKHVVIRNNVLDGVPGDGIVPIGCEGPLVEYNIIKNCPATLPPSEACDGIWPWSCDNAVIQYNIVSDHKSQVDGYGLDADYNCTNSLFQYNLTYNNDGGFLLLCNSGGWPADWSAGNRGTIVRYNISINDGLRNYIVNGKDDFFSPVIHITGSTKNSRIEKNIFIIYKKPDPRIDKRIICSDDWRGYADSTFITQNYISVQEKNLAMDATQSTNNFFYENYYSGPLTTPKEGFIKRDNIITKALWYDRNDKNWEKLIVFIKDRKVSINGKKIPVLNLVGLATDKAKPVKN